MSAFSKKLLEYHTTTASSEIGFENLKRLHPSLNEDNIYALAIMATNPAVPEEEREMFMQCLKLKQQKLKKEFDEVELRIKKRSENAVTNGPCANAVTNGPCEIPDENV